MEITLVWGPDLALHLVLPLSSHVTLHTPFTFLSLSFFICEVRIRVIVWDARDEICTVLGISMSLSHFLGVRKKRSLLVELP